MPFVSDAGINMSRHTSGAPYRILDKTVTGARGAIMPGALIDLSGGGRSTQQARFPRGRGQSISSGYSLIINGEISGRYPSQETKAGLCLHAEMWK